MDPDEIVEPEAVIEGEDSPEVEPEELQESGEEATGEEETTPPVEKTVPLKALEDERRKRQELEEILKAKEAPAPATSEKTIYDHYEDNPKSVMDWLNNEIGRLSEEDPYGNARQIESLRDQKIDLREYGQRKQVERVSNFSTELNKAVPNFQQRHDDLLAFAISDLGYTRQEAITLTNPAIVGESAAIKTVKLINRQYEQAHAGETLEKKGVKPQPTQVERGGAPTTKTTTSINQLKAQAMKSGSDRDWAAYIEAGGT